MVRTDAREQKLDAFVVPESLQCADSGPEASVVTMETDGETEVPSGTEDQSGQSSAQDQGSNSVRKKQDNSCSQKERFVRNFSPHSQAPPQLLSQYCDGGYATSVCMNNQ